MGDNRRARRRRTGSSSRSRGHEETSSSNRTRTTTTIPNSSGPTSSNHHSTDNESNNDPQIDHHNNDHQPHRTTSTNIQSQEIHYQPHIDDGSINQSTAQLHLKSHQRRNHNRRKKQTVLPNFIRGEHQEDENDETPTFVYRERHDGDYGDYGDTLTSRKPEKTLRILFQNVNNIPEEQWKEKGKKILETIQRFDPDFVGLAEMGLYPPRLSPQDTWQSRVRSAGFKDTKATYAYNKMQPHNTAHLTGGLAMLATKEASCRCRATGDDPTGLGRWTSILIEGRQGHKLRVVTAYNPCETKKGVNTVYKQHKRYFRTMGHDRNPNTAFLQDLQKALEAWLAADEQLIVMMDANQDIRSDKIAQKLKELGLRETIISKHEHHSPAPATHQRNKRDIPIDGIWTTLTDPNLQCGYLGFGEGLPGDHRLAWIEIPFEQALGINPPGLHKKEPSRLTTQDPRIVDKYQLDVMNLFETHKVFEKLDHLIHLIESGAPTRTIIRKYNQLDTLNRQLRKQVEKKLRKIRAGAIPWFPELQKLMNERMLWTNIIKFKKRIRISLKMIRRQMKRTGIMTAMTVTVREAQHFRDAAQEAWLEAVRKAPNQRKQWLESLAEARAKKKGTLTKKELKALQHREKQREAAYRQRLITKKGLGKARTTKLYFTDSEGNKVECTSPESMGAAGVAENETRMCRANDTPFGRPPLKEEFGTLADTEAATAVLEGTYEPPETTDRFTKMLLEEMRIPTNVKRLKPADLEWTPQELETAWKKQKLQTSAEPTGLSFAHLMVGALHPEIAMVDAALHNLPFQLGFSPDSWKAITDVAILKKPGEYSVEKMRTIMLMDSYFNMNNKRLGRLIMAQQEESKTAPSEAYGGRKNHRAVDQGLNQGLIQDLSRMKRWAIALIPFDASQCYDRIHHVPASLAVRSTGIPDEPVRSMFETLQQSTHRVSTAYGVSTQSYGGPARQSRGEPPPQGIGQGSGAGPAVFHSESAKPVNILRKKGYTLDLSAPFTGMMVILASLLFVDDKNQTVSGETNDTPGEEVAKKAQEAADIWEGCLHSMGGAINGEKSCWYLLDYKWKDATWKPRTIQDMPAELKVRNLDGTIVNLDRKEAHEAVKYLGMFSAPDGTSKQQKEYLLGKTTEFANKIRSCSNKLKNDVWITMKTGIMKTLEYPMRATTLTSKDWYAIMKPLLKAALPHSGFSRNFPRVLLYGPHKFQGMELMDPWVNQELQQLQVF